MKVFEGPHRETAKDITFMYNADFFLFASLHHESDGQHGRPNPQNGPPVLTGMPVSSMILLDRPEEAGYFIFSDLSVRHEGCYYLTFALLEEVKEDRDKDPDEPMSGTDEITGPTGGSDDRHFCFRTKVQTDVFDVFSAKKFPGLQESTALSRTVAEQGCRVRIRRDVRMRRREKGGKGKDPAAVRQDEYAVKARAEPSPPIRGRSSSNDTSGPFQADGQRRPSGMDYTSSRPSFASSETSAARPPPYGHMAPYPPHAQSIPNSPSFPPPPLQHGAPYPPRPSYGHYTTQRSPIQPDGTPISQPAPPPREAYYRSERPILAPKLEADPDLQPSGRHILPPIRSLNGAPATEPRKSSYTPQPNASMPRLLPHPPPPNRAPPLPEAGYLYDAPERRPSLPPMARPPPDYRRPPSRALKRTAADAFQDEMQPLQPLRLQNGRREDEQPRDANYRMEPPASASAYRAHQPLEAMEPNPYKMSEPHYNRASSSLIPVDFPSLHD